jgi:hypothetical protein
MSDAYVHAKSTMQLKDPVRKNAVFRMNGYFAKFGKSKLPFTSLHKFHTNIHPSLAKSGPRRRRRFTKQSASWKLNDINMKKL